MKKSPQHCVGFGVRRLTKDKRRAQHKRIFIHVFLISWSRYHFHTLAVQPKLLHCLVQRIPMREFHPLFRSACLRIKREGLELNLCIWIESIHLHSATVQSSSENCILDAGETTVKLHPLILCQSLRRRCLFPSGSSNNNAQENFLHYSTILCHIQSFLIHFYSKLRYFLQSCFLYM